MKKAIYPGTFDPITNGHIDIIKRANKIFDEIIVAVSISNDKSSMFNLNDRLEMIKLALGNDSKVIIKPFDNLLVNFINEQDTNIVIRGIRAMSDFEYELQMGYANMSISDNIEVVYLMPRLKNIFISSTIVRSILKHDSAKAKDMLDKTTLEYIRSNL